MLQRSRSGPRHAQPPISARLIDRLPPPFVIFRPRPVGAQLYIDSPRGAIPSGAGYTGITADQSRYGWGLKSAGGTSDGIAITFSSSGTLWDRTTWCWAGLVRIDTVALGAIVALNGTLNGLELRINTSNQVELLNEGVALLATSTYAGFTAGAIRAVAVLCSAALNQVLVYVDGQLVITYSGTIDNKDPTSAMEIAMLRRGNTSSDKLPGTLFGAVFWSGVGLTPAPQAVRELTSAPGYFNIFRKRRRGPMFAAANNTVQGSGTAAAPGQAIGAAQQLTVVAAAAQAAMQATGAGQALARADGTAAAPGQAIGAGQVLARADGVSSAAGQAAGAGQTLQRADGAADAAAQAVAVGDVVQPGVNQGAADATGQAVGEGLALARVDGAAAAGAQAIGAGAAQARGAGAAQAGSQAVGEGRLLIVGDGAADAPSQAIGTEENGAPPPPPPPAAPQSTTQPGYRHNPRTPRELDPLPADDLADQVREKWDAIERANEAVRKARRGPPPAAAVAPTQAPAPKPQKPRQRRATAAQLAAVAGGIGMDAPLTPEQLADEEAFILLVAEIV